jgi:thioredoxin 1
MASEKIITLDDSNFSAEVEKISTPVLVDFGATWCGPCKAVGKTLDSMIDGYQGKVKFCYVDIQNAPMTAQKFEIRSVPTLILFKNGNPVGSLLGAQPKAKIASLIESTL